MEPKPMAEVELDDKEVLPSGLTAKKESQIIRQVQSEYTLCYDDFDAKRQLGLKRLKLYNNQKRDQSKVGDPLLFTVFNTVFAELYEDRLSSRWEGREEGDDETAENLTALSEFDHGIMEKDEVDYDWGFDACFYSKGYVLMNEFDRAPEIMAPVPEVLDPMTLLRDPDGISINGNVRGKDAFRFWGWEGSTMKWKLKDDSNYFNVSAMKKAKDLKSMTQEARQARAEALGRQQSRYKEENLDENYNYEILNWFTHVGGKKYLVSLANQRNLLIRYQEVKGKKWPAIERSLFPIAHELDGVSIPDLIEDKQRARSVMINLGMESAKADLYPMYLFDKKKITNPNDLTFGFNKFVPVKGDTLNAVAPIQKSVFHQQVNLILNILDMAAQKAVAAPEVAQGVQPSQTRTLGETQLVAAGKDSRHSLGARIFGWSERRFWQQWYRLYKDYFKGDEEISKKVVRIQGPLAPTWRTLTRENIIANIDPDVFIESAIQAETNRKKQFDSFGFLAQMAIQDPATNRPYVFRKLAKITGVKKSESTMMFPPTIHELRAEDENSRINENKLPKVNPIDEDIVHLEIHNRAVDTKAKLAHIEAHKHMMMYKAEHPDQFPPKPGMPQFTPVAPPSEQSGKTSVKTMAPQQTEMMPA